MYVHMHVGMHVGVQACVGTCMHACVYYTVYVHVVNMYVMHTLANLFKFLPSFNLYYLHLFFIQT